MKLIDLSVSAFIHRIPHHKLSLSISLRISHHFYEFGFIHRKLKLENLLIRLFLDLLRSPICLIDFDLTHIFGDQKNGQHEQSHQRNEFCDSGF
jgi:serine/threonine protein kinase